MKVELSRGPAVDLGGAEVLPERRVWDVVLSGAEAGALARAAKALSEHGDRFPLDPEAVRVLASAVEAVQLVARRGG